MVFFGVGCVAVGFGAGYFVSHEISKRREQSIRDYYMEELSKQNNGLREYYKKKLAEESKKLAEVVGDITKDTELTEDEAKDLIVEPDDGDKEVNIYKGKRASEPAKDKVVEEYHKMYGEPKIEKDPWDCEPVDDDFMNLANPHDAIQRPYLVKRAEALGDEGDYRSDYKQYQLIWFVDDVEKGPDGEFEHVPVLYAEGERCDVSFVNDDPYHERTIKKEEAMLILGHEWKDHFGDDTFDDETGDGYDYDANECVVRNDALKAYFWIQREQSMYKVVIAGLEPGDPFDYSKVR